MAANKTDVIAAIRFYVDKIATDAAVSGTKKMKVLLLDAVTTKIVSMVYSQTQVLEQDVYLVEQLGKAHEPMLHLNAAIFVQPTEANLKLIAEELRHPKYAEYHLFFSNVVPEDFLSQLARLDEHDLIKQVQEYFGDFLAINEDLFHLGISNTLALSSPMSRTLESGLLFDKNVNGVLSLLLATKRKPSQIRYQSSSDLARRMATDIVTRIEADNFFEFRNPTPMLLILDRRDDPITPLLTQWTYQAMVHEILGLKNNRVSLKNAPGIKKDLEQVVLSCTQDDFFARHRYDNFGDLGAAIKELLDTYQRDAKLNENISSIEDMQNFMERYPAFRSRSINVSKHVALMSELARLTDVCQLLDVSRLEQEIVSNPDHTNHKRELLEKLASTKIQIPDKIRLCLLFLLRYESYDETRELKARLQECGVPPSQQSLLDAVLDYAGESKRAQGLFTQGQTGVGGVVNRLGRALGSLNGVENVYTQHQPLLSYTLDAIVKGKLKDSMFPLVSNFPPSRISEVFVYIVGGVTFEEATKVAEFNAANPNLRVLLGGSCIHNSQSFLEEVNQAFGR